MFEAHETLIVFSLLNRIRAAVPRAGGSPLPLPVQKLIASNKLPHLLFYGPPGTGKTSTILACAKKLYGNDFKMMVLEVSGGVGRSIRPCGGAARGAEFYTKGFMASVRVRSASVVLRRLATPDQSRRCPVRSPRAAPSPDVSLSPPL